MLGSLKNMKKSTMVIIAIAAILIIIIVIRNIRKEKMTDVLKSTDKMDPVIYSDISGGDKAMNEDDIANDIFAEAKEEEPKKTSPLELECDAHWGTCMKY